MGTTRISGKMLDYDDFTAIAHTTTTRSGGKGGSVKSKSTTYTYTVAAAICLAEGTCTTVGKIWADKTTGTLASNNLTFFNGAVGQSPWGYMLTNHPSKALRYSGTCYVAGVIDLGSNSSLPNFNFELYGLCQDQQGTPTTYLYQQYAYTKTIEISSFSSNRYVQEYVYGIGWVTLDSKFYEVKQKEGASGNKISGVYVYSFNFDDRDDGNDRIDPSLIRIYYIATTASVQYTPKDANPADIIYTLMTNQVFGAQFPVEYIGEFSNFKTYCNENNLLLSEQLTSQTAASDTIDSILEATNSDCVWSQGKFKIIPYYDGVTPVYDITADNIIAQDDDSIVTTRNSQADSFNVQPLEFLDRANDYNTDTVYANDQGHIDMYGVRQASVSSHHHITVKSVAQKVAQYILQKQLYIRNQYVFKLDAGFILLDPMDCITLSCATANLEEVPVRIVSIRESKEDKTLEITAEDNPTGSMSAPEYDVQNATRNSVNFNADPGNVNEPIFFEPPADLVAKSTVLVGASGNNNNWGGCNVWASFDGNSYKRIGTINKPIRQGVLRSTLPIGYSLDQVNSFNVDLSASKGMLLSASQTDFDQNYTLSLIDKELIAYKDITLINTYKYNIAYLKRGLYGTEIAAHSTDAEFTRLDDALFSYEYSSENIGKTVHVKFTSFNVFGIAEQALADVEPYTYIIGGNPVPNYVAFTVTQSGTSLVATVSKDMGSLYTYELRMGATWDNSTLINRFNSISYTFDAPNEGTLTFWLKAIDRNGKYSANASKAIVTVVGLPERNVIYEYNPVQSEWIVRNMWRDSNGKYRISSVKTLRDYERFSDIFGTPNYLRSDAEILLPVIDLGPNILDESCYWVDNDGNLRLKSVETLADFEHFSDIFGATLTPVKPSYAKETFANVDVKYTTSGNARVDVEYRTSLDGVKWGSWVPASIKQFNGRYVQGRLLPVSVDGLGQVYISSVSITIDVPDIEEIVAGQNLAAERTHISYKKKFGAIKQRWYVTRDTSGKAATNYVCNETLEGFDIEIWDDNGNIIAGRLDYAGARGY